MSVGGLAVVAPPLAIALPIAGLFLAFAFRNLALGVALFTALSFFEELPGVPSSGVSFLKVAGAVLLLSWLLAILPQRRRIPILFEDHPLVAYATVFFVAAAFASRLWSQDPARAQSEAFRLFLGVVLLYIVFSAVRERQHIRWVVAAFIGGAVLSAVVGMIETPSATA